VELGGIQPNPTDPKVYEGIELGRREGIDFLLPVGGGSVIDTAKSLIIPSQVSPERRALLR
jgi:alcohol dehydrogenase YqhD (iron-dependent ADH family)